MERNDEGHPAAYLGDGAYVSFTGFDLRVYTERDGIRHWVSLEPEGFSELLRFAVEIGLQSKYLVKP